MIDTKAIRAKVLDLALRGMLTEQRPEDGTAEELLCQIRLSQQEAEKSQGTKVSKSSPVVTDGDKPFSIPDTWLWVRMGDVFSHNTGKALNSSIQTGTLLEYITTSNVYWDRFELSSLKSMYFTDEEVEKCTIRQGDLLICEGGDIGRSAIWPYDSPMRIQNHIHRLRSYSPSVDVKLYYYVMRLYKIKGMISGRGIGLEGFSSKRLHSLVIPLPPANEQHRIVATIDAIFSLLDTIDTLQSAYTANQKVLRAKLIDAAIRGQLTEQLPEDGMAEDLYQQIQQEKKKLIQTGIIKKEKPYSTSPVFLPFPFEIPENWKFVRLGDLMINRDSERIPVSVADRRKRGKVYDYYGASGVIDKIDDYLFDKDLLLLGEDGANLLARSTPIAFIASGKYWVNNHAHVLDACSGIEIKYVCHYINAISLTEYVTGSAQPKMNQENMNAIWIALPPPAEQKRIVAKLEELLPLCE